MIPRLTVAFLTSFLVAGLPLRASTKAKPTALVKDMRRCAALIGKGVLDDGGKSLSPKSGKQKPFFVALKDVERDLDALDATLAKKDEGFDAALHRAGKSVGEIQAAWEMCESKNATIDDGVRRLREGFDSFREATGKAASRRKKGGDLTDKEKADLSKMKASNEKLLAELKKAEAQAGSDAALAKELKRLEDRLTGLAILGMTLDAYFTYLYWVEDWSGYWYVVDTWVSIVDPTWIATFQGIDAYVASYDAWYFEVEEGWVEDFAWVDADITLDVDVDVKLADAELDKYDAFIDELSIDIYDTDGDGTPDVKDADDDNDGIPDVKDDDDDNDGIMDNMEADLDGDGIANEFDADMDDDGDGVADAVEADADDDGEPDAMEAGDDDHGGDDGGGDDGGDDGGGDEAGLRTGASPGLLA